MKKNLEIQDKKRLFSLFFNIIKKDISFHIPNSEKFKYLTKIIKKFYNEHLKKKKIKFFYHQLETLFYIFLIWEK